MAKKFAEHDRDELGYVIPRDYNSVTAKRIEQYNARHQRLAMGRIQKARNEGRKPSKRDLAIAYNLYS